MASRPPPDSWLVSTTTARFSSGTRATRDTIPDRPPVCVIIRRPR